MIAIVFPGQGSESEGMLAALDHEFPVVSETFAAVSEVCAVDLWKLAHEGPEEMLNRTENTQPAMLAAGVATWRVWEALGGPRPDWMAGHSLGEYSALVAAGALSLEDAALVVRERARAMQRAVPPGAGSMAAVLKLDDEQVAEVCREAAAGQVLAPANFNAPGQVVIAGHAAAVERALERVAAAGGRAIPLSLSVPAHCALMEPAREALAEALSQVTLRAPAIPVLHNADVRAHEEPAALRGALLSQLAGPVHWAETVRAMVDGGVRRIAECGPGRVLTGLSRRIDRSIDARALTDPEMIREVIADWTGKGAHG